MSSRHASSRFVQSPVARRRNVLTAAVSSLLEKLETRSHFSIAPVAVPAGPYSVAEGQSVVISGLASTDADGTVATYQWDTNYSAGKGFKNRLTGGTWTFTADNSGTRNIALRVVDNSGDVSAVATATINISDVAPTITLTAPTTANEASPVNVSWTHTDPGTLDVVTAWDIDWGDDTTGTYAGTASAGTHTYAENGSYTITLTATQADGPTSVTHNITVNNVAPVVVATTPTPEIDEGEMVQLHFSSPNRGSTLDSWTIDWGDGKTELLSNTRSVAAHFYTDSSNYTATVYAQEPDGGNGSATVNYVVNNVAATVTQTNVPATGTEGTSITLGSTVVDAGQDDTHQYGWTVYRNGTQFTLPGGTTLNASSFTFTPTDNGSYVVRLSVLDDEGAIETINSTPIIVGNVNPTAVISGEPVGAIDEGTAVNLTVTPADVGAEDTTFSYAWSVAKGGVAYTLPNNAVTNAATFGFTPNDNGSYVATVVVTDDDTGFVSVSTAAIVVNNVDPTAGITGAPATSPEGTVIQVAADPHDAAGDTFAYSWSVEKNGNPYSVGVTPINQSTFAFTPSDDGSYVIHLTVTDDDGGTVSTSSSAITVTNAAPTAVVTGPTAGTEGSALNFSVAASDAGADDTHDYLWTVTKGGVSYNLNGAADTNASFSFTPNDDAAYVVSVAVTDNDGGTVTQSANVTVANAQPVVSIDNAPATAPEGTAVAFDSTVTDAGANDTFNYLWSVTRNGTAYAHGAAATNDDFSFTPANNGSYVVTLAVTDNGGAVRTVSTSAITVTNAAPTGSITGEPVAPIGEGASVDLVASGLDAGINDVLSYAWAITKNGQAWTPLAGTVLDDATLSFVPTDNGSYVATVTISDADGGHVSVDSTTVLVTNSAPVAAITGAPAGVVEGTGLNLAASVTDDGAADTHTYAWTVTKDGNAINLTGVTTNAAAFVFTPRDNGAYVISLAVTDDDNATMTTSANVTVTNAAPAPVISGNSSVNEDAAITLNVAANDVGVDDTHTYLWSVSKGGVAYTTNLGATNAAGFTFTPNLHGSYAVSCVVTDNSGAATTATKTITVNNLNPTAAITGMPSGPRAEGSPITLHGTAADVSGETALTYAWSVKRNNVTFPLPGGTVTNTQSFEFTPTDNGLYRATLVVTDSGGLTGSSTTSNITVTNALPDAAITGAPVGSVTEGTAVSLHVDAADPGAEDTLSYAWSVTKNGFAFALPGGTATTGTNFTFTPTDQGTYVATVHVTDDDGGPINVSTAAISVTNVAPTIAITGTPASANEGALISVAATATDPGAADVLTYSWYVSRNGVQYSDATNLSPAANTFSFTPADNGTYVIHLMVNDGLIASFADSSSITVNNVAPTGTIGGPATGDEGSELFVTVAAVDAGSADTLTYAWSVAKDGGVAQALSGTDAVLAYTPADQGSYVFGCVVSDGTASVTLTHTVAVANVAPAVGLTGVPATGTEGTAITVGSTATDPGDDSLTYGWTVYRNGVHYVLASGTEIDGQGLTFTPTDDGSYVVRLTVTDGDAGSTTKNSAAIVVGNAAPAVTDTGDTTGTEGQAVARSVSATDAGSVDEAAGFTYAWTAKRNGQTVASGDEAEFSFVPGVHGTYVVTSVVTDKDGDATTTATTVSVDNVAPSSVAIEGELEGYVEGEDVSLVASADDVSGDTLSYAWQVFRGDSAFASGTGSEIDFTAARGNYQIVVTATDSADADVTDTFEMSVGNAAPTGELTGPTGNVLIGANATFSLEAADVPANQALSVSWDFGDGSTATTSSTGDATIVRKHAYAARGTYDVTATISDGVDETVVTTTVTVSEAAIVADPTDTTKTALIVVGSNANDTIAVGQRSNGKYGVSFNGTSLGNTFAPTGRIYVYGNGGSNTISVSGQASAVVFAGSLAGNVSTGSGNDIIVGSGGADRLNGNDGRDILIGAAGADVLRGGDGEDMLIAGSTTRMNDTAALNQVMAKWSDGNQPLAARRTAVKAIFGSKQLVSDAGGNQLYGDGKNDWMILNSSADKAKDLQKTDVLN